MAGATQRQQLLANNLANANTPGFKRSDVDFHAVLQQVFAGNPALADLSQVTFQPQTDSTGSMRQDGNNVDVDSEMASLSQNTLDYQAMVSVMTARVKILETTIGTH